MPDNNNILLISLQPDLSIVGFKRLHYYLLEHGFNSFLLHNTHYDPANARALDRIREFAASLHPLFIGFSLMSTEFDASQHLSDYLRGLFPGVPILWGGIHPSIAPETCFPHADYVCLGEGEGTILDFAEALRRGAEVSGIGNLAFLRSGELIRNPLKPLIEDLDGLPRVDHIARNSFIQEYHGRISPLNKPLTLRYGRYQGKFYDMLTSIGCPFACTYCCSSAFSKLYGVKRIRRRSIENSILELERGVKDNDFIQLVNFQDENFLSHDVEFITRFAEAYRQRVGVPFMLACIPVFVSEEKISRLREAGLTWVRMGLQSGSDRVCKEIYQRGSLRKHFYRAMEIFLEHGVSVYTDVIVDNPLETEADQLETVEALTEATRPYYLQLYSLAIYLGTEIRARIQAERPERLEDASRKDFYQLQPTTLNMMIRLAPYLPRPLIRYLSRQYRQDPRRPSFRAVMLMAKLLGIGFFEPWTLFRVMKKSQGGSWLRLLRNMPVYLKMMLVRYLARFSHW